MSAEENQVTGLTDASGNQISTNARGVTDHKKYPPLLKEAIYWRFEAADEEPVIIKESNELIDYIEETNRLKSG